MSLLAETGPTAIQIFGADAERLLGAARIAAAAGTDGAPGRGRLELPARAQKEAPDLGVAAPNDDSNLRIGSQQIAGVQNLVQQRVIR